MYDGTGGSNLSLFNAMIQPHTELPGGKGQYIEVDASFPDCFASTSTFNLMIYDDHHMIIGEADFEESDEKYSLASNSNPALIGVTVSNSGSQSHIAVTVTGADVMTTANRWILSAQDRCADIWYNQDYTVYGLSPAPGPQSPTDGNVVTLLDLGNGTIALQCGGGYYAFASMRDDYNYQVQFQAPSSAEWITQVGANEIFQAIPTGDGYFALYSPHFSRYVAINPSPNPKAGNCNALTGSVSDIASAARFTATGLDRNSVFDFVQIGRNASGLSFAGVDLANVDLSGGINLSKCDFTKVTSLNGCNLGGDNLRGAKFGGLSLEGLKVAGTDFTGADFTGCHFDNLVTWTAPPPVLEQAILTRATIPGALSGLNMQGAVLTGANLTGCYMVKSDLTGADFRGATLTRCNLQQHTILTNAHFENLDLTTTMFTGADLSGAHLAGTTLTNVNLTGTTLAGTDFTGTDLSTVRFPSPLTRSTDPNHPTIFAKCTLPYAVIGLDWSYLDLSSTIITGLPANSAGQVDLTGLIATSMRRPEGDFGAYILDQANFANATLDGAIFTRTKLRAKSAKPSFAGASLIGTFFTYAVLDQADFTASALGGVQGEQAADFSFAYLSSCDFDQANLYGVKFPEATLIGNTLKTGANLQQTDFTNAYLPSADFTGANLRGAVFDGAFMVECILAKANLSTAQGQAITTSLSATCLQAASLQDAILAGTDLSGAAITDQRGSITQQHYDENGTLTTPFPMRYQGGSLPDATSFSDKTICPNGNTYKTNVAMGKSIAQMLTIKNPPTQWTPKNAQRRTGPPSRAAAPDEKRHPARARRPPVRPETED
jgi:uncharacterized protein YjbI with pentapeptide repeats